MCSGRSLVPLVKTRDFGMTPLAILRLEMKPIDYRIRRFSGPRPRSGTLQFLALRDHRFDQFLHLDFGSRRVHAGEFQALAVVDAGVADDGDSPLEKALSDPGVDL